jgi:WD40 repeat protein
VCAAPLILRITGKDGQVKDIPLQPGDKVELVQGKNPAPEIKPGPSASPFDRLRREDSPAHELKVAGRGDPQQAPLELVAVIGDSRLRHWSSVGGAAFSPDGKTVFSASGASTLTPLLTRWSAATGEMDFAVSIPSSAQALAVSPDGTRLAIGVYVAGALLLDAATGKTIRPFPVGCTCDCVLFTSDGKRVLTGSANKKVQFWEADSGKEIRAFEGHDDGIRCMALSRDEKFLVTGGYDKTARIWDLATGKEVRQLKGLTAEVRSVSVSPDARRVAVAQRNRTGFSQHTGVWDSSTGERLFELEGGVSAGCVAYSPDGKWLAAGSGATPAPREPAVRVWSAATGKKVWTAQGRCTVANTLAFSPDSQQLVSTYQDGTVRLWDTTRGGRERFPVPDYSGSVRSLAVSAKGSRFAALFYPGSGSGDAVVWDVASRRPIFQTASYHLALSADGQWLASGKRGDGGLPQVWDIAANRELIPQPPTTKGGGTVAFNPQGTLVAMLDGPTVGIWDPRRGAEVFAFTKHTKRVYALDWSTGANRIASACQAVAEIKVWDPATGTELVQLQDQTGNVVALRISPDGTRLAVATGTQGRSGVYDLTTGKRLFQPAKRSHFAAVFSPDSRTLAVPGEDGGVVLQDATTGKTLRQWQFLGAVNSVAYAPDGRHLLVGNGNGTIYVLRLATAPTATAAAPFLLVAADGKPRSAHANLPDALEARHNGDLIEVHGNGPFTVPNKQELGTKDLRLRAAPGYRPRFLRGLEAGQGHWFSIKGGAVHVEGCDFLNVATMKGSWFLGHGPVLEFRSCRLLHTRGSQTITFSGARLRMEDCLFVAVTVHAGIIVEGKEKAEVELINNILVSGSGNSLLGLGQITADVRLEHNTIDGPAIYMLMDRQPARVTATANVFRGVIVAYPQAERPDPPVQWQGRANHYSRTPSLMMINKKDGTRQNIDLASWRQRWGDAEQDGQASADRFQWAVGRNLIPSREHQPIVDAIQALVNDPSLPWDKVDPVIAAPRVWQLEPRRIGPDGKDVGADVSRVAATIPAVQPKSKP